MQRKPKLVRITPIFSTVKAIFEGQNRFLADNGFEVHVVTSPDPSSSEVAKAEGFQHHAVDISRSMTLLRDVKTISRLTGLIREIKPDIIHTHTSKGGLVGMTASYLAGVRHRVHSVAGWTADFRGPISGTAILLCEKLTLNIATQVIVNSRSLKDYLVSSGRLNPKRAHVLGQGSSNGVDLDRFTPGLLQSRRNTLRSQYGIRGKDVVIAFVGRIMAEKGIVELLEAFKALDDNHTILLLIGSLEQESRGGLPEGVLNTLHSHPRIRVTGWTDDVPGFLSASEILVHPSHHEGLPNALLQGSAMQLPCIASRVRGNIDAVKDGETGILYQNGDIKQLADCMRALIRDESLRKRLGSQGRIYMEKEFDRGKVCGRLLAFYHGFFTDRDRN
ncbi:MAG TPA: glycosyltransferase family 4 protein [Nitrospirota bacterium]|nr:glycosyltransferase family 4 protein [Nitrospirota bacterium]